MGQAKSVSAMCVQSFFCDQGGQPSDPQNEAFSKGTQLL